MDVTHRKQKIERNVEKKGRTKISGRSEVTKTPRAGRIHKSHTTSVSLGIG